MLTSLEKNLHFEMLVLEEDSMYRKSRKPCTLGKYEYVDNAKALYKANIKICII